MSGSLLRMRFLESVRVPLFLRHACRGYRPVRRVRYEAKVLRCPPRLAIVNFRTQFNLPYVSHVYDGVMLCPFNASTLQRFNALTIERMVCLLQIPQPSTTASPVRPDSRFML